MRYILTSELITAKRALELGIVSEVYKAEELHTKVLEIAS
jgi:enoyl-CoA hydratase/carnithine racemase